jgi:hypothetical protein
VEVLGIEHFGFALVNPGGTGETLTLGTMAISARNGVHSVTCHMGSHR